MSNRRQFVRKSATLLAAAAWATALPARDTQATPVESGPPGAEGPRAVLAFARLYSAVRYFHPGDAVAEVPWEHFLPFAVSRSLSVDREADIGPTLMSMMSPIANGLEIAGTPFSFDGARRSIGNVMWYHEGLGVGQRTKQRVYYSVRKGRDSGDGRPEAPISPYRMAAFPLAGGWYARMPVALGDDQAKIADTQRKVLDAAKSSPAIDAKASTFTRTEAIAVGIAAWSIPRQFYVYFPDVTVDWDAHLETWIRAMPAAVTREQLAVRLRELASPLDDGHVAILDDVRPGPRASLPLAIRPIGDHRYLVSASKHPEQAAVGDEVLAIDEVPMADLSRRNAARTSGSPHYKGWAGRFAPLWGAPGSRASLRIANAQGVRTVSMARDETTPLLDATRASRELEPGIEYVDLPSFKLAAFEEALPRLRKARAILFDLRGYPSGDVFKLMPYWLRASETATWMHVPVRTMPFAEPYAYRAEGWNVRANPVLADVKKILLIDGRAISYAESVTGYFAAHARGTMVGEPTAGANGNVSTHDLPGGFALRFTGMQVTTHDGKRFHAKGFQPDILVRPTIEGIRAGRDEILEKAIAVAKS